VTDRIGIHGLRAHGHHGVLAHERRDGQEFIVDATLEIDTAPAAVTDALDDTVDYGALSVALAQIVEGPPVDLLETLAQRLADACLTDARVSAVEVTVHKPHAPVTVVVADVTVTIRRTRA
jgi:dihydroneopterin aldolase